ncbi:MAG: putative 2-dehydropantoate 2-reductase [Planctomycetaceae bacterium]|jgi:2-dehydropantoate 2-reductase|nr:putative 2-dehydropantoate 2-reductase [Planctomycetaceae bacterium]MCE2814660.1 putative 2-dehydropantoate 2-reductase [Planctomycetaceae bacterium]
MGLRYCVLGTGALGGFYGGLMAKRGLDIHFLLHSDFEHVVKHGLRVDSKLGNFVLPKINAYAKPQDMPKCDVAIIGLKSTQNHLLEDLLKPILRDDSIVLVLQNGLNVEQTARGIVGPNRVAGGCCFLCSNKVGPGHIRHLDYGRIVFGAYRGIDGSDPGPSPQMLQAVLQDMVASGIEAYLTEDLPTTKWKKLMWNIPFNGLSVLLNASTDAIMNDPDSRLLARRISEEVRQIALAAGSSIEPGYVDWVIDHTDDMVPYDSSMRLDYLNGRAIEVEAIYGNALQEAQRCGFAAPIVMTMYQQLKFMAGHRTSGRT